MLPEYLCAAAATMALLLHGDATGEAIVSHAVHSVFQPQQKSASPEIAEMLALGKNLREQLALLPKFSECPRVSPELGQLLAKPV